MRRLLVPFQHNSSGSSIMTVTVALNPLKVVNEDKRQITVHFVSESCKLVHFIPQLSIDMTFNS